MRVIVTTLAALDHHEQEIVKEGAKAVALRAEALLSQP